MKYRVFVALTALVLGAGVMGQSDPDKEWRDRVRLLEEQNREILSRLQRSESKNEQLEGELATLRSDTPRLSELETRIGEMVQETADAVTWGKLTKSGNPIRFYGFVRFDAYLDTARANSVIIPFRVLPEGGATKANDAEFAFDSRLTRIGIDIDAGTIGDAKVTGKIETDFANFPSGGTESRETPRIRLAYINIDLGDVDLRFGQDWDIISPLYPAVNSELLMWNAGNLGDRRPQAQLIWTPSGASDIGLEIRLSAGMSGAVSPTDFDATSLASSNSGIVDAFDSGHPHGQLRIGIAPESWVEGKKVEFSVWGYVAGMETDTKFAGEDEFTPWTVGLSLILPIVSGFELRGEFNYGQALGDIRGNIGQTINTTLGEEIAGFGGWGEFRWQIDERWRLHFGGSIDDPDNDDLNTGNPELNWTTYIGAVLDFGKGLVTGLDVIYWETQYLGPDLGNMIRVNWYIQLNF